MPLLASPSQRPQLHHAPQHLMRSWRVKGQAAVPAGTKYGHATAVMEPIRHRISEMLNEARQLMSPRCKVRDQSLAARITS